jgi:nucleoside phosphorylase
MATTTTTATIKSLSYNDYTIGWVCALPKEQTAATVMLDKRHRPLQNPPGDPNSYTLGSIGGHNIVIACLPQGQIGANSAATIAAWMISTFSRIKIGLMVGIGGGIPGNKVRLGDVVVSSPTGQFPGVVQWDMGKESGNDTFERTGALSNPPTSLLTALGKIQTAHALGGNKIPAYLEALKREWPDLASKCLISKSHKDVLFKSTYAHVTSETGNDEDEDEEDEEDGCKHCDKTQVVKRKPRDSCVHYGLIASGNRVISDAVFRNKLNKDLGGQVLCVDMEAAGLMNNFPCVVIRGICDYADSHKNDIWQEHAAVVAAAFAKDFLQHVQPGDIERESLINDLIIDGKLRVRSQGKIAKCN